MFRSENDSRAQVVVVGRDDTDNDDNRETEMNELLALMVCWDRSDDLGASECHVICFFLFVVI